MLPVTAPVATTIAGSVDIEIPGEYQFCGEAVMGARLFVGAVKV
jgi:hypothetical protein